MCFLKTTECLSGASKSPWDPNWARDPNWALCGLVNPTPLRRFRDKGNLIDQAAVKLGTSETLMTVNKTHAKMIRKRSEEEISNVGDEEKQMCKRQRFVESNNQVTYNEIVQNQQNILHGQNTLMNKLFDLGKGHF